MSPEASLIAQLRGHATHPAARGLMDDAAVLEFAGKKLVLTHDTLVQGVHFLPSDPAESVAWKLVAVNLSDLAAKGARPLGALMSYALCGAPEWDARFTAGLAEALDWYGLPLLGGDTVSAPARVLGMTLVGVADGPSPDRRGAHVGDALYVTGTLGDAMLGLRLCQSDAMASGPLVDAYQRPVPQQEAGIVLAPRVSAMMDVSDGLLIDATRLAEASGLCARIDLDALPLSPSVRAFGSGRAERLAAATGGDDYQLLFTAAMPLPLLPCPVTRIGQMVRGEGVLLYDAAGDVPLPDRLGWEHV